MEKQEFLDQLRMSLNGRIPTVQVTENINYYDDYINTEVRKGRALESVMQSLGDPRLIAKTIIQTQNGGYAAQKSEYREFYSNESYEEADAGQTYRGNNSTEHFRGERTQEQYGGIGSLKNKFLKLPGWLWSLIALIVFILIIVIVFKAIAFLAPLIIVLAVVSLMVKIFRDWLN